MDFKVYGHGKIVAFLNIVGILMIDSKRTKKKTLMRCAQTHIA